MSRAGERERKRRSTPCRRENNVERSKLVCRSYCFGGTTALELARSGAPLAGVVELPRRTVQPKACDARNITGKVLVCHGALDPLIPLAQVTAFEEQMSKTSVDWQVLHVWRRDARFHQSSG